MTDLETLAGYLIKNGLTITTAESCTGGLIAGRLIDHPGISEVYSEGFVTYSNEAKIELLGVDKDLIDRFGVVSDEVARAMAEGAAKRAGADVALSSTGIAGPAGGDEEHPVGLVYIGCYYNGKVTSERFVFKGDRQDVRHQAVDEAIILGLRSFGLRP